MPRTFVNGDEMYRAVVTFTPVLKEYYRNYFANHLGVPDWLKQFDRQPQTLEAGPYKTAASARGAASSSVKQSWRGQWEIEDLKVKIQRADINWIDID